MKCICCKKEIKLIYDNDDNNTPPEQDMWDDGCVDSICPGYGSKYDMIELYIGICDDCIKENLENDVLVKKNDW